MKDKKNETNNNLKEAEELKKIVNNSSNELIKNLTNIFSATKFESSNLKSGNVDIYINMDSMANEINSLLNVVNKLKIKELKKKNHLKETQQKIEEIDINIDPIKQKEKEKERKKFNDNLQKTMDIYQNINNELADLKKSEFYTMSKRICGE
jgi:hypothetical protein